MWLTFSIFAVRFRSGERSARLRLEISRRRSRAGKRSCRTLAAASAPAFDTNAATKFAGEDSGHYTLRVKEPVWATISSVHHNSNLHVKVVTDHVQTPSKS